MLLLIEYVQNDVVYIMHSTILTIVCPLIILSLKLYLSFEILIFVFPQYMR